MLFIAAHSQQIVMPWFSLFRKQIGLLDLPEALIVSILRHLPTKSKCQAEAVCKTFRRLLSDPAPGSSVWDHLSLEDSLFQKPALHALNRQAFPYYHA